MKKMSFSSKIYLAIAMLFLYLPIIMLIVLSFNSSNSTSVMEGFSLRWYVELFRDEATIQAFYNTLVLAVLTAVTSTFIGTLAAVGIDKMKKGFVKTSVTTITNIPMMNPEIVTGVSMMLLFVFIGSILKLNGILGFWTLFIAHVTFCLPYVILNIMPKLKQTDVHISEAAQDLGCTKLKAFLKVVLPAIRPGIFAGFIMAFTLSLDDFIISYFVSGPKFQTLPIRIFSMTKKRVTPDMYALSTLIFAAILILLVCVNVFQSKDDSNKNANKKKNKKMKRIAIACVALVLVVTVVIAATVKPTQTQAQAQAQPVQAVGAEINVYNWGEYISDGAEGTMDVNKEFEKLTGIKVNYTTYDSNENMYNKIKGGGANYDIIIPSDYMIQRMIEEDMLEKIDFSNIPNYSNILDEYKNLYFDPTNEYSVPYNVGMVGLIYNTKMVKGSPDSWGVMWDEKYSGQILMFNNPRDAFGITQCYLGIDLNTTSDEEWNMAYDKLKEQKPLVNSYVMDDVFNKMESGEAAMCAYYAGDYLSMKENNPDLGFVYPKEGTNIFVDSMCIPKGCQNKEGAELYINFLLSGEVALANAEYICYASPNKAVVNNPDYSLKDEKILYPEPEDMPKTQYYHNLPEGRLTVMTTLWDNLKIEGNDDNSIYVGLISFTAICTVYAVYRFVRKKKREKMY